MRDEETRVCDYLRAIVPVMRELGIAAYAGITLGSAPSPAEAKPTVETPDERNQRLARDERDRLETLMGRPMADVEFDQMHDPERLK